MPDRCEPRTPPLSIALGHEFVYLVPICGAIEYAEQFFGAEAAIC